MSPRIVANDRLIDWEKLDNLPSDVNAELLLKEDKANKWIANWYAELDWTGKVPSSQIPSWIVPVDSVNWKTWVVVLDTDDIAEWTNKYTTAWDISKLAWIEALAEVNEVTLAWAEALTNKSVNWVTLTDWWASTDYLNAEWNYITITWGWDMTKAVYDPTNVVWDAFDQDNMVDWTTNKNYTAAEKTNLGNQSWTNTWDQDISWKQDILSEWAFIDWDKTKLDWIEALAEVNNISDANATDLTDAWDSTLHYHASDRDRANHTWTQTASTISDFDSATVDFTNKTFESFTNLIHADAVHFKIYAEEDLVKGDVIERVSYDVVNRAVHVQKRSAITIIAVGIMNEDVTTGNYWLAMKGGLMEGLNTNIYDEDTILFPDTSWWLTAVQPEGIAQPICYVFKKDVSDWVLLINVQQWLELPVRSWSAGKFLKTDWTVVSWDNPTSTAWQWVSYFLGNTIISWDNYNLSKFPEWWSEVEIQTTTNSTLQPVFVERYVSDEIGWNQLDAWLWTFSTFASVDSDVWTSTLEARINRSILKTWTITSTWTWATRTFTATEAWTFVPWDANASILEATLIQTPTETFFIDSYVSWTEVTATSDNAWYTNESAVAFSMFYKLFQISTWEINGSDATLYETQTVQPEFEIDQEDKILIAYFATATTAWDKVVSLYKNGTEHYSNFVTPLIYRHNDLKGLNENWYQHLTEDQLAKLTDWAQSADTLHKHSASWVTNTPAWNIAATDVQNAINELDTEKIWSATTDTLTNKTFDANWTWNSLSNVDVVDLADWTDWELITWASDWTADTVAVWTADQVLTSNWVWAAPTFQDAGWGGGWPLYWDWVVWVNWTDWNPESASLYRWWFVSWMSFTNAASNFAQWSCRVPDWKTTISSIKIFFRNSDNSSNLYLKFRTWKFTLWAASSSDTTDALSTYATSVNTNYLESATIPSAAYDWLWSVTTWDVVWLDMQRDASNASDTFEADLLVNWIEFTFT